MFLLMVVPDKVEEKVRFVMVILMSSMLWNSPWVKILED